MKKIIIQGDDWGYKKETTAGINKAYTYGILTETDVMANLLDPNKISEYRKVIKHLENKSGLEKPPLGIGVHLNLTYGHPITKAWPYKNMVRPFKGSNKPEEWQGNAWSKFLTQYDPGLVKDEFEAQIQRTLSIFNEIDHLDSHHFIHSYSPIKEIVLELAAKYQIGIRTVAPLSETPVYGGDFIVDKDFPRYVEKFGLTSPDNTVLKLFWNESEPQKAFLQAISEVDDNMITEFMFHPAVGKNADDWRKKDFDVLTHPLTLNYFRKNQIQLITYSGLKYK